MKCGAVLKYSLRDGWVWVLGWWYNFLFIFKTYKSNIGAQKTHTHTNPHIHIYLNHKIATLFTFHPEVGPFVPSLYFLMLFLKNKNEIKSSYNIIFWKDFCRIKNKRKEYYNNVTPTVCTVITHILQMMV